MNTSIDQDGENLNISRDKQPNPAFIAIATTDQQDESNADSG